MPLATKKILQQCFGSHFKPDQKYVIAVQGCSTSGKSTFANELFDAVKNHSDSLCKPIILGQDDFYKHKPESKMNLSDPSTYDMDNPGSIDWKVFSETVKSLLRDDKIIKKYKYEYATSDRAEFEEINPGYNFIIVEGLFSHNLFNSTIFNIKEFDCIDSNKEIKNQFIPNEFGFEKYNFKLLKIFLDIDKKTMLETRINVDWNRDKRSKSESTRIFDQYVYPSTEKWIRPTGKKSADISLLSGTRDTVECASVFDAVSKFFGSKLSSSHFLDSLELLAQKNRIKLINKI